MRRAHMAAPGAVTGDAGLQAVSSARKATRRRPLLLALVAVLAIASALVVGRAGADPPVCSEEDPPACLYRSDLSYDVGVVDGNELVDAGRNGHRIPILVRYPIDATGPRPVVLFNHGGEPRLNGKNSSAEWGDLLAAAGYVVIHPSRMLPQLPLLRPQRRECEDNGFATDETTCQFFLGAFRYGAENNAFIIDNLGTIETWDPALAGLLDHDNIAVAGHSGGTTSVHINAGARQQFLTTSAPYRRRLEQVRAFFATAPQGPMYAGFPTGFQSKDSDAGWTGHSWQRIKKPYMFVTGIGDETGEPPESRVAGFLTSKGNGTKLLLWDSDPDAVHETMDIHRCDDSEDQANHCLWIGSAGLAWFDALLRGREEARDWLLSDAMEILSDGAIELHRR